MEGTTEKRYEPEEPDAGQVIRQIYGLQDTIDQLSKTYAVFEHLLRPVLRDEEEVPSDSMVAAVPGGLVPLANDIRAMEMRLDHIRRNFNDLADRVTI